LCFFFFRWDVFFFRWLFTFVGFGQKLGRGSFSLSDDDSESGIYILSSAAPADTLSFTSSSRKEREMMLRGARVFINVAQQ